MTKRPDLLIEQDVIISQDTIWFNMIKRRVNTLLKTERDETKREILESILEWAQHGKDEADRLAESANDLLLANRTF